MTTNHTCTAVVVHCIDFRFGKIFNKFFTELFPDSYDLISIAGGVKDLLQGSEKENFILKQIVLSCGLHGPGIIALIQHEDCGAYGGSSKFASPQEEQDFHKKEMDEAGLMLKKYFSQIRVSKYYARLTGEVVNF